MFKTNTKLHTKFHTKLRLLSVAVVMSGLTGCSSLSSTMSSVFQQEGYEDSFAGSGAIFQKNAFTQLNLCNTMIQFGLAELVDSDMLEKELTSNFKIDEKPKQFCRIKSGLEAPPENSGGETVKPAKPQEQVADSTLSESSTTKTVKIENGKKVTETKITTITTEPLKKKEQVAKKAELENRPFVAKRNGFAHHVMALSEQKCGVYKNFLLRDKAKVGTLLGSMTTLFASTSTVLTNTQTAKLFAAGSTASSGINAVYSKERFATLTMEVLTAGIDKRRAAIKVEINENLKKDLLEYPVTAALADALHYHASCSAVTGFEVAKQAIAQQPAKETPADDAAKKTTEDTSAE